MEEGFGAAERLPWVSPTFSIRSFFNPSEQRDQQSDRLEAGGGGGLLLAILPVEGVGGGGVGVCSEGLGSAHSSVTLNIAFVKVKSFSGSGGKAMTCSGGLERCWGMN